MQNSPITPTHLLTLKGGYQHPVEIDLLRAEFRSLSSLSPLLSIDPSFPEDPNSSVWYYTPIADLLVQQGSLTLTPL